MIREDEMITEEVAAKIGKSAPHLVDILVTSIEALAKAGEVEAACRLAGQACVTLRPTDWKAARRFDALLHRLAPKVNW